MFFLSRNCRAESSASSSSLPPGIQPLILSSAVNLWFQLPQSVPPFSQGSRADQPFSASFQESQSFPRGVKAENLSAPPATLQEQPLLPFSLSSLRCILTSASEGSAFLSMFLCDFLHFTMRPVRWPNCEASQTWQETVFPRYMQPAVNRRPLNKCRQ